MILRREILCAAVPIALLFWGITSCQKETDLAASASSQTQENIPTLPSTPTVSYTSYTIPAGAQYCEQEHFEAISTQGIAFTVLFDSSAVYSTKNASNQADINKLYGFSDNRAHHHSYRLYPYFGGDEYAPHKITIKIREEAAAKS